MEKTPYKLSPTAGTMPADKIVGREAEIVKLKKLLQSQSVRIEEFRRMGKTLFLQKYAHVANESQSVIYFSLQGVSDIGELIDVLIRELKGEQSYSKIRVAFDHLKKVYSSLPDVNIEGVSFKLPKLKDKWKEALAACLLDIAQRKKEEAGSLVIILDELPIMIWDWINKEQADQAIQFLDTLRRQRQILENEGEVRFVICGSIGLNVVLSKLKKDFGYTGEPFNDVGVFALEAMTDSDAKFLIDCLILDDFKVDAENKNLIVELVLIKSEKLPFYINKLFDIIRIEFDDILTEQNVEDAYYKLLNEPKYGGILKQLEDRIGIYYEKDEAKIMFQILSCLSKREEIEEAKIAKELGIEKGEINNYLFILHSEHYLMRRTDKYKRYYSFKYKIVKEWWRINKA